MRFSLGIVPALLLVSTVFATESSVSEAYNVKDINQRLVEDEASLDFNSMLNEMESELNSVLDEDDGQVVDIQLAEDSSNEPLLRAEKEFGVVEVDLKPYLNLLYNLLKPIDPVTVRNKFLKALFEAFDDPLFGKTTPNINKSLEDIVHAILKGINPFESTDDDKKSKDDDKKSKDDDKKSKDDDKKSKDNDKKSKDNDKKKGGDGELDLHF